MSTGCSKKLQHSQSTRTSLCHNGKHNSNAWLCLYLSNSSIQQPDSQVNNCSMCPLWTWTIAFNRRHHWSTIRIREQVHLVASEDMKLCRSLSDSSHRTVQLHARCSVPFWQSSAVHYRPLERWSLLCQSCTEDL